MSVQQTRKRTEELLAAGWRWQSNDDHEIWLELRLGKKVVGFIWPDGSGGIGQLPEEQHQKNIELGRSAAMEQGVIDAAKARQLSSGYAA